jgi:DNA-binding NtrC family response regulator
MKQSKEPRKILLVDDETVVLDVTKIMIERMGYRVTATSSSVNALDLFRTDPDNFDLVITDMIMPHMTGDILARKIIEIRFGMPVILYSGYSIDVTEEKAKEMGIKNFIRKPFNLKDLSEAISKILENE